MKRLKLTLDLAVPDAVEVTRLIGVTVDAADDLGCEVRGRPVWEPVPDLQLIEGYGGTDGD